MPPRRTSRRPTNRGGSRRPASRGGGTASTAVAESSNGAAVESIEAPPAVAVSLPPTVTVRGLSELLDLPAVDVIKGLLKAGVFANINQTVDFDTAAAVATDLGFEVSEASVQDSALEASHARRFREEEGAHLRHRPPVVTIMGHVDHGKTSLLDAIRETNVTESEVGGITQHIGAYQTEVDHHKITFLDTPGHEAFTAMRARGAHVTDIATIVIAADDGIMPQTIEAIDHAKAASIPIIIALNKIDRPDANQERVKRQLAEHDLLIEEWGGNTICVPVSARTKEGLPDLLEHILLVAELEELKGNPGRRAEGVVIEGQLDQQRGPMATLLVQTGTLRVADPVLAGHTFGRIRAMFDEQSRQVKRADPSTPVKVLGLDTVPQPGDLFAVQPDERIARKLAEERLRERQHRDAQPVRVGGLQDIFERAQAGQGQELNVVLKADVQGSIDPIRGSLLRLGDDNLRVKVLHAAPGNITESDVMLALASEGIVLGFNTRPEPGARRLADVEGAEIRTYEVIYQLIDDIEQALKGMLAPTYVDVVEGHAEVRQIFKIGRRSTAAGCTVTEGKASRSALVRIVRQGRPVAEDKVANLKRFKDEAREVAAGLECGVTLEDFTEFREGDVLEFYRKERSS